MLENMQEAINKLQEQMELLMKKVLFLLKKREATETSPEKDESEPIDIPKKDMGRWIFLVAQSHLGKDIAKRENELGCAESVCKILNLSGVKIENYISTMRLFDALEKDDRFYRQGVPILKTLPGDIIISPTGYGQGVGHVGIAGEEDKIFSNNSKTFVFDDHLTKQGWYDYFSKERNFPIFCFRWRA